MPGVERRTINGHQSRKQASLSLGCAIFVMLFGVPFAVAGLLVILSAADVVKGGVWHIPRAVGVSMGLAFFIAGAALLVFPCRSWLRGRKESERAERLREEKPREPWLVDHEWDPSGAENDERKSHVALFLFFVLLFCFLVPFHWFAFFDREAPWFVGLFLLPFDVVLGVVLYVGLKSWLRLRRYGDVRLRFERFPFYLGDSLAATLLVPRLPADVKAITLTLRHVEERIARVDQRRAGHGGGRPRVLRDQIYAGVREIDVPLRDAWGGVEVPASVPLPTSADFSTRLFDDPPRYWEMEAKAAAAAAGVDLYALFLLPVYARPEAAPQTR